MLVSTNDLPLHRRSLEIFQPDCSFVEATPNGDIWWAFVRDCIFKYDLNSQTFLESFKLPYEVKSALLVGNCIWCGNWDGIFKLDKRSLALDFYLRDEGSSHFVCDPSGLFVWCLTVRPDDRGIILRCFDLISDDVPYSRMIPNPDGFGETLVGFAYALGYVWFSDASGNICRVLARAPWTLEVLPTISKHLGHVLGNTYFLYDFTFVRNKLFFMGSLYNGSRLFGERNWILQIDLDNFIFDLDSRFNLSQYGIAATEDCFHGLNYRDGSLWLAAGSSIDLPRPYASHFLKFGDLEAKHLKPIEVMPTRKFSAQAGDRRDRCFIRPILTLSDGHFGWWSYSKTSENQILSGLLRD